MGLRPLDVVSNIVQPYKLNSITRRLRRANGVLHDLRSQTILPSRIVPTGPWTQHDGYFEYDGSGGDNVITLWPKIRRAHSSVDIEAFAVDLFEAGAAALTAELIEYNPANDSVSVVDSATSPGNGAGKHRVEWDDGGSTLFGARFHFLRVTPASSGDLVYSGAFATSQAQAGNPVPGMSKVYGPSSILTHAELNDLQDAVIDHESKIRGERTVPLTMGDVQIIQGCSIVGGRKLTTTTSSPIADLYIVEPQGARIREWAMYVEDQDGPTITASLQELNPATGGVSTISSSATSSGTSGDTTITDDDVDEFIKPDRLYRLRFAGASSMQELRGAAILVDQPPSHP